MRRLAAFITVLMCSGCAIGPLVGHETARTVGSSTHEITGGYGSAGYVLKWNYGVGENFDLGLQIESLSAGLRAKYALIQHPRGGFAFALAGGTGLSIGGSHYYGDLSMSELVGWWEPYLTARFVHVRNDPVEFRNQNTGQVQFTVDSIEYDYGQALLGNRIRLSKSWALSIEASSIFSLGRGQVAIGRNIFAGGALVRRF